MSNFPKNEDFLPSDTQTYLCVSRGKKCSFFGKFDMLCFLGRHILRLALFPYYRRDSLCLRCREQYESHPHFVSHRKPSKSTLDYISELIYLNYTFKTLFKVSLKTVIMEVSSKLYDGMHLKIHQGPTLIEVFLRYISFCERKVFYQTRYSASPYLEKECPV